MKLQYLVLLSLTAATSACAGLQGFWRDDNGAYIRTPHYTCQTACTDLQAMAVEDLTELDVSEILGKDWAYGLTDEQADYVAQSFDKLFDLKFAEYLAHFDITIDDLEGSESIQAADFINSWAEVYRCSKPGVAAQDQACEGLVKSLGTYE